MELCFSIFSDVMQRQTYLISHKTFFEYNPSSFVSMLCFSIWYFFFLLLWSTAIYSCLYSTSKSQELFFFFHFSIYFTYNMIFCKNFFFFNFSFSSNLHYMKYTHKYLAENTLYQEFKTLLCAARHLFRNTIWKIIIGYFDILHWTE